MGSEVSSLHPIKFSPIFLWYFKRRYIVNSLWNKIKSFPRMFKLLQYLVQHFKSCFCQGLIHHNYMFLRNMLNLCKYQRNIVRWKLLLLCRPTWRYFGSIVKIDFGQELVTISLILFELPAPTIFIIIMSK